MDRWIVVDGDGAGRFVPHANEQVMQPQYTGLRLYNGDDTTDCDDGLLTLTSHRLVWEDREGKHGSRWLYMPLSLISHTEFIERFFTRSPKVKLLLFSNPNGHGPASYSAPGMSERHFVLLSFRQSSSSEVRQFRQLLTNVLHAKTWRALPVPLDPPAQHPQSGGHTQQQQPGHTQHQQQPSRSQAQTQPHQEQRAVGIAGILQRDKQRLEAAERSIKDAFSGDLKVLEAKAKQLVELAERYTQTLAASSGGDGNGDDGGGDEDQRALQNVILQLGIANPITKKQFKSATRYHQELARELATVYEAALKATRGGMLLLADAFCVANRVRGIDLVSPQDVLKACEAMEALALPVRLRAFKSGVLVVELATRSDEQLVAEVKEMASADGFLTASRLATRNNISVVLAAEQLLLAEAEGALCRDDAVEGLRFYPNRFLHPDTGS
ncbi:hypothetical protein PTSG_10749 [Salpingoeca rosetta]|uniref:Vacuolar protein-sorting-associated protein 36 n=1 Tax=Salpingoeca rosetta (strain ATCC 50818 / BSB-021) TaxID=946362 RepID=F2UQ96_SALR5|nr:uncharacterized protein PTSG_10749 [Salpingoeca rosetta]EGD79764.1 hypothetical protein PTSG_10749 [Salpingoeca rosetta]|eukprot:XP_004988713.1 hypothetical protein PTSG_10749 [Salpingoeca rosetta]